MSKKDNDKQNKPDNYLRGIYSSKRRALIMQPPETLKRSERAPASCPLWIWKNCI